MNTKLVSKIVMGAMFAMNAAAYAEDGFNLNRITKDTLGQAYVGEGKYVRADVPAAGASAEKSGRTAAEKPAAAAKPALAAKVPFPSGADKLTYNVTIPPVSGRHMLQDVVFFIPRVIVSVLVAPFALFGLMTGQVAASRINLLYRIIW